MASWFRRASPGRPAPRPPPRLGPPGRAPRPPPRRPRPSPSRAVRAAARAPAPRRCLSLILYRLQPVSAGLGGAPPTMCCERGAPPRRGPAWRARAGPRGRGRVGRAPARSRGRGSRKVTAWPFRSAAGSRRAAPAPAAGVLDTPPPAPPSSAHPCAPSLAGPGRWPRRKPGPPAGRADSAGHLPARRSPARPLRGPARARRAQARGSAPAAGRTGSFQFGCEPRARRRGPRVLPPAPTSPGFVNSRIPAVPLGGGDGGLRGPGELAARLHGSLASPPLLQRRQHRVALRGCERAAGLSQHPRPGARASSPPGGRRRPRRCAAA